MARLKELFQKEIQTNLKNKFGFKNTNMTPKLEKVVINMGLGVDGNDSKILKVRKNTMHMMKIINLKMVIKLQ